MMAILHTHPYMKGCRHAQQQANVGYNEHMMLVALESCRNETQDRHNSPHNHLIITPD